MATDERIDWYRSPIDREALRQLTERSDWKGFQQVGLNILLLLATGTVTFIFWRLQWWIPMFIALYAHCSFFAFFGMGVAGHELQHRTVFKTRVWNEVFCWLVSVTGWANYLHYRHSHTRHHQFTVYSVLDQEEVLPKPLPAMEWFWAFTIHLPGIRNAIRRCVRLSAGRLEGDWEHILFSEDPALRRQLFRVSRVVLATHVLLAAVFIYFKLWIMFPLFTFAPFIATALSLLCYFPQHAGLASNVPDFRLCSRTILLNPFFSFLYWQMNHHLEHHMYAAVPCYNLPKLRRLIEADLPPAPRGLWATWKHLLPVLRRQATDPTYVFTPTLPKPS